MSIRVLSLVALLACAAAAVSGLAIDGRPQVLPAPIRVGVDVSDDAKVREARAVTDFLGTLGSYGAPRAGSVDQSFYIGGVYPGDRQILAKTVQRSSTILTVHKEYINFSSTATIHCIQVVDLLKTGKNAVVTVQSGGIGQRNVSIKFKSRRGGKINYVVIIWGQ
ncbi:hypothetical protein ONE63_010663 [Megalurothrips usitatus]|uniref:Salivary secreted peptide n=1 Tax=Megalurothrips usitatus TaxID=439358 RepID=A0AAV7XL22_9NEOP|nr:hypothetical protein ONE63_010663 [Megalurothrips usitatus]